MLSSTGLATRRLAWHDSWRMLSSSWSATFLLVGALSLALTVPLSMYLLSHSLWRVTANLQHQWPVTLVMQDGLTQDQLTTTLNQLRLRPEVTAWQVVPPEKGLAELPAQADLRDIAARLGAKSLPTLIELSPQTPQLTADQQTQFVHALSQLSGVAEVVVDQRGLRRLAMIVSVVERFSLAVLGLFSVAVAVIIANTVRLHTQQRSRDLTILRLLGADETTIRRPFLYTGFCLGGISALLSWGILRCVFSYLDKPVRYLAASFHSNFTLTQISFTQGLLCIFLSAILGAIASFAALKMTHE